MKLSDFVIDFLASEGIKYVFGLTGGAVVHLFDSVARHSRMQPVFCHHEQAAALAAQAYSRVSGGMGAAFVTTGPGGTNAMTGLCAAWLDSIPCIFVSGQARIEHTSHGKPIRQVGSQEFDIVSLVSHLTNYAVMVENPGMIRYHLEKAAYLAKTGRPGPVWIDLPLNFQWAAIEPDELPAFDPSAEEKEHVKYDSQKASIDRCIDLLSSAKRPLLLAGHGIRLAGAVEEFRQVVGKFKIPFLSTWNASDILPTDHNLYIGRPGISGQRGANLAMQNCDLLLAIGSHLSMQITGSNYDAFAREAKKIVVDIDQVELDNQRVKVDLPIQCNAKSFLEEIYKRAKVIKFQDIGWWVNKCSNYKKYNCIPQVLKEQKEWVNSYVFIDVLSDKLENSDIIVVDGGGTVVYTTFQAIKIRSGQRLIESSGIGAMGTGLPESIGACFANRWGRTICLCGDGSMQLNIQELETIVYHRLPIKIFLFNNGGYLAIRHTQDGFLNSDYVGSAESGGLSLPDFQKVAQAYGIPSTRVYTHEDMKEKIQWALQIEGPALCEIMISPTQELIATQGFKKNKDGTFSPRPLEDMYPLLNRREFRENMITEPYRNG